MGPFRAAPGTEPDATGPAVADRRAHERHAAHSYVCAIDAVAGQILGELEDISLGGFKLQVRDALQRGGTYTLQLDICIEGRCLAPIAVTARNIWVHGLAFDGIRRAGFVFIRLSAQARGQIEAFFAEMSRGG